MMEPIRQEWLDTVRRHRVNPDRPANDRYWAERLERMSRDELRAVQGEKLRVAVRYAFECIPFYRRKFDRIGLRPEDVRGFDDLEKIPVTTKQEMADDLAEHPPWGTYTAVDDRRWLEAGWQVFASSGTTARARPFRYTAFDRETWAWHDARALWAMGFRPGRDSALLAFGYGPHVWLWGVHYAFNLMGIPIVTAGGLDSRTRARFLQQYRPTILCCTPSYALYLASVVTEDGGMPAATSVRYLFCAGEPGFSVPATRRRLEEVWDAELHEFYGCTEAAPAAGGYTCSAVAGRKDGEASTHLMEDGQIWETVEPESLKPVGRGTRGLSVVTNLCSEASPQLRFLVGDFTRLSDEPCECGRTDVRAIGGFLGRADDMLNVRGVTVFPASIEDAIRRVPEAGSEFEIVLTTERSLDVLTVRVEPRPDVSAERHAELGRRIESEIVAGCELRPIVEVVTHGTLPRTEFKAKRVRDRRGDGD
jgi:phenylacetate-CoA ligase